MSTISAGTTSTTTLIHSGDTTGSLVLKTNDTGSGGTTAVTIDTSQNVGIGTSSPSSYGSPLSVYAATNPTLAIASGNANAYLRLYSTSDNNMYLTNTGGSMTMITANTERMRIDSSGNVLVGTTGNPAAAKFFVAGTSAFGTAGAPEGQLTSDGTNAYLDARLTGGGLIFRTNGSSERMRILSTGNILSLSGGSTTATGTGIAFPATQSASSDANTLDDYEEGTWSAVVAGETGTITSYAVNSATYTKTGDTVYVFLRFTVSNKGTGSNFVVSGLPFTPARELLGIWAETNTTGLTGFMFNAGTGQTSFTSRLAASWGGACLVNGSYTVEVTYKV